MRRFMEDVNIRRRIFQLQKKLSVFDELSGPDRRDKFVRTQINFFSDFLTAIVIVVAWAPY